MQEVSGSIPLGSTIFPGLCVGLYFSIDPPGLICVFAHALSLYR